jgi:type II secretory pathway component GspD/PulD (secretin)
MRDPGRFFGRNFTTALIVALVAALLLNMAWAQRPDDSSQRRLAQVPPSLKGLKALTEAARALAPPQTETEADDEPSERPPTDTSTGHDELDANLLGPLAPEELSIPLQPSSDAVVIESQGGRISLVARGASLQDVLTALAEIQGLNIIIHDTIDARINTNLHNVPLDDALEAILAATGHTWARDKNIIQVMSIADAATMPLAVQRREVFHLDYVSATDVNSVVTGMLSAAGTSYIVESATDDNRRTEELLVVQDLPQYVEAVRAYICQHDVPPRQVLVEAYILQVKLSDDTQHGVNFNHLFSLSNNMFEFETQGFANSSSSQGFMVNLSGGNLTGLVEMLSTTTDAKTLAAPKIRVLNGQLARIQVGEQLGFRVTTTTETSTTESVEFLDVGVVLEVTPRIGSDGTVIMHVRPEVSSGQVNPATGLPEEETTELDTHVMFHDNQAFVIGGLIQEIDSDSQSKIPWLGDWRFVGHLFRRKEESKQRTEIIIALLPHVMPFDPVTHESLQIETERALTPLLYGPLHEYPRPWEAQLPDAVDNPSFSPLPPVAALIPLGKRARRMVSEPMEQIRRRFSPPKPGINKADGLVPPPVYTSQAPVRTPPVDRFRITRIPLTGASRIAPAAARLPAPTTMLR